MQTSSLGPSSMKEAMVPNVVEAAYELVSAVHDHGEIGYAIIEQAARAAKAVETLKSERDFLEGRIAQEDERLFHA